MFSSSDSSTITFLREAARRDGLVGDMVAMNVDRFVVVAIFLVALCLFTSQPYRL